MDLNRKVVIIIKVLVACEESQRVCMAFRELGHEAYSCDLIDPSGGHLEWHIKDDVLKILNGKCEFKTMDGIIHNLDNRWDMIIAFPPCTHLAVSGARWFETKRKDGSQRQGIEFFCKFFEADCDLICIENPVNIISGDYVVKWFPDLADKYNLPRKASQEISPHLFGSSTRKKTHYWLKGLKPLKPTNIVEPELKTYICKNGKKVTFSKDYRYSPSQDRSKTPIGIAKAMAEQWGNL